MKYIVIGGLVILSLPTLLFGLGAWGVAKGVQKLSPEGYRTWDAGEQKAYLARLAGAIGIVLGEEQTVYGRKVDIKVYVPRRPHTIVIQSTLRTKAPFKARHKRLARHAELGSACKIFDEFGLHAERISFVSFLRTKTGGTVLKMPISKRSCTTFEKQKQRMYALQQRRLKMQEQQRRYSGSYGGGGSLRRSSSSGTSAVQRKYTPSASSVQRQQVNNAIQSRYGN